MSLEEELTANTSDLGTDPPNDLPRSDLPLA